MMAYAYRQELPTFEEDAPEWYVWGFIQAKIDQCAEVLEAKRESGKKGGNVKQTQADASKAKQSQAKSSTWKQSQADASKAKQKPHIQEQEYEYEQEQEQLVSSTPNPYELTDDELRRARQEQSDVETAARRVGLPVSAAADFDSMDKLRAEHGAGNLIRAIDRLQGAAEKSRNWRYVGGILRKEKALGYTWADKPPDSAKPGQSGRAQDTMLRYSPEERRETYSAAVVDFDEEDERE